MLWKLSSASHDWGFKRYGKIKRKKKIPVYRYFGPQTSVHTLDIREITTSLSVCLFFCFKENEGETTLSEMISFPLSVGINSNRKEFCPFRVNTPIEKKVLESSPSIYTLPLAWRNNTKNCLWTFCVVKSISVQFQSCSLEKVWKFWQTMLITSHQWH